MPIRASAGTGAPSLQITQGRTATVNAAGLRAAARSIPARPATSGRSTRPSRPRPCAGRSRTCSRSINMASSAMPSRCRMPATSRSAARSICSRRSRPNAHGEGRGEGRGELGRGCSARWTAIRPRRPRSATMRRKAFWPRLQQLGFTPRDGEPPARLTASRGADRRPWLIGEPHVVAESQRLLAAWQRDPKAIPGSLKDSWLGVIAQNADARRGRRCTGSRRERAGRSSARLITSCSGCAKDDALARRALDLSITKEPGATVSAAIIAAAAENHPAMALDFVLSHLAAGRRR